MPTTPSTSGEQPAKVILRDGFLEVRGAPTGLADKLRYFKKEIKLVKYRREVRTSFEDLFSLDEEDPTCLYTMSGFAHKVLDYFRKSGRPFEFSDARTPMPKPDMAKAFKGLRPYQIELAGKMLVSGGGILQAATGAGKTAISAAVIRAYDRNELVSRGTPTCVFACPDRDINRKNWEEFRRWLPDREIGLIMSGTAHKPSDDVVCCTIDSLENIDPAHVGILIVDEMHTSASVERAKKISAFTKAVRWGVSATPTGRFDGADMVAEGLYGPIVATFSYQDGVRSGALVPITVYWIDAPEPTCGLQAYSRYQQRETKIKYGWLACEDSCQMIADILNCIPDDLQTLCMLQFIEQMGRIHAKCTKSGFVHAETNAAKIMKYPTLRAIKPKERKELYDAFRRQEITSMISTHCWKQGVDFPDLSVVVNAGGGGSDIVAKQVPGRASRATEGKDHAYIVDFMHPWDRADPIGGTGRPGPLLSNDYARRKAYKELGFTQCQAASISQLPFLDKELVEKTPTMELFRHRSNLIL